MAFKHAELAKYFVHMDLNSVSWWVAMNIEVWNSLPKDIKKIIDEVSEEYAYLVPKAWDDIDDEAWAYAQGLGMQLNPWSDAEVAKVHALLEPLVDEWVTSTEAEGIPAKKYLDDVLEIRSKYVK